MNPFLSSPSSLFAAVGLAWILLGSAVVPAARSAEPPLIAHAHNDYVHDRPLLDALDCGFHSVEADAVLHNGQLLIGHTKVEALVTQKTFEELYLKPLEERVRNHRGAVHDDRAAFFLLIDIKTDADETYRHIHDQLERHASILSVRKKGDWTPGAVTVVISGNVPRQAIVSQDVCYAGIDGRPDDLASDLETDAMPWISAKWSSLIKWNGKGEMSEPERQKLREYVAAAHARHRLVRFWGTPDQESFWKELRGQGVDLIGTDDLSKLEAFCRKPLSSPSGS